MVRVYALGEAEGRVWVPKRGLSAARRRQRNTAAWRRGGGRTVGQVEHALVLDLKLQGVGDFGGVVQHVDAGDRDGAHAARCWPVGRAGKARCRAARAGGTRGVLRLPVATVGGGCAGCKRTRSEAGARRSFKWAITLGAPWQHNEGLQLRGVVARMRRREGGAGPEGSFETAVLSLGARSTAQMVKAGGRGPRNQCPCMSGRCSVGDRSRREGLVRAHLLQFLLRGGGRRQVPAAVCGSTPLLCLAVVTDPRTCALSSTIASAAHVMEVCPCLPCLLPLSLPVRGHDLAASASQPPLPSATPFKCLLAMLQAAGGWPAAATSWSHRPLLLLRGQCAAQEGLHRRTLFTGGHAAGGPCRAPCQPL